MMHANEQSAKAQAFLALHKSDDLLILPNIWNPIGAKALETNGYPAIATASAAIAESLGYEDGENIKLKTLLEILLRISKSVKVPVTADIESGYADTIDDLKEAILAVIDTGVVGINIEDSLRNSEPLRSVTEQCDRISAIREISATRGLHLVINARVDSFISGDFQSDHERIEDAIMRANLYTEAGADCIYPIGPGDSETLTVLREQISSPLNVLASPNALSLTDLHSLGINRVSFGPFIFRSCLSKFVNITN
ncbi:MAG: isocitrate lyase/phosphoenolpyruvate mutase family protein, partial [Chloroflexota bacterium]